MPEPAATRRARPVGRAGASDAWEIRRFASLDSTNRFALDAARAGAPDGLVVVADHQTAGRGRLGRSWIAAPGSSLLVSVLLRTDLPAVRLGLVTMAAALSLREAVRAVAGVEAGLKWPNDLVVGDRKLAGILAETDLAHGADTASVVVGAGCNVTASAVVPELADAATSIEDEAATDVPGPVLRSALLDAYLDALAARLAVLDDVPRAARAASATLGQPVLVDLGDAPALRGDAVDITDVGSLVVRDASGGIHTVASGDVVHLRTRPRDA